MNGCAARYGVRESEHLYAEFPHMLDEQARHVADATRSRMRRRDRFSISSIQLADLGRYLSALLGGAIGCIVTIGARRTCYKCAAPVRLVRRTRKARWAKSPPRSVYIQETTYGS